MVYAIPIEEWDNKTLIDLTIKQGLLVSKNDVSDSAQKMREDALERNKRELLRRLEKSCVNFHVR